ncbi:MAG: hypothetical protein K2G15_03975 [Muribaculaceae bacterium]|nr:hypothetical protein [Muribaculaceae bacterium]
MESNSHNSSILLKASLAVAFGLLLCLCHMPYGFYTVIRLATAVIACCWAYKFYTDEKTPLTIVAVAIAILFQPLIMIVLDRTTWHVIDVLLAFSLIILVVKFNHNAQKS